jgi:hypothetical protein
MQTRLLDQMSTYTYDRSIDNGSSGTFPIKSTSDYLAIFQSEVNSKADRKLKRVCNHEFTKTYLRYMRGTDVYAGRGSNAGSYSVRTGPTGDLPYKALTTEPDAFVRDQAVSRLYDKMRGNIDLSIDLYQAQQTVRFVKNVAKLVSFVNSFPRKALEFSYMQFQEAMKDAVYKRHAIKALEKAVGNKRVPWLRKDAIYDLHSGTVIATVPGKIPKAKFRNPKSEPTDWRGAFKGPGSLWLEYRYGAGQTMQTLYDITIELTNRYEPLMRVDGKAKERDDGSGQTSYGGISWLTQYCSWTQTSQVWIRMQYRYSADTLQLLSKFTSLNPVSFIYENIPFSFVADWAWDFGSYLRNTETAILSSTVFVGGFQIRRSIAFASGTISGHYEDPGNIRDVSWGDSYKVYKYKQRLRLSTPPIPRVPRFKVQLSSGRMLNAAALLTNLLGKR